MSYTSITQSTRDNALLDRILAAVAKEAFANVELSQTNLGLMVKSNGPESSVSRFIWPICVDNEAAYESALIALNENPGGDPAVITDLAIGTGVQIYWPHP